MNTRLRIFSFGLTLVVIASVGYVVGSIRGARLANLNWQILQMHFAYGMADAMRSHKSNIVFPDSEGVAHALYRGVVDEPWLHEKLVIPIVEWNQGDGLPEVLFGVSDAERHLTTQVGQFLIDVENESNKVATADGVSPHH